jgi:hypothetical protein
MINFKAHSIFPGLMILRIVKKQKPPAGHQNCNKRTAGKTGFFRDFADAEAAEQSIADSRLLFHKKPVPVHFLWPGKTL